MRSGFAYIVSCRSGPSKCSKHSPEPDHEAYIGGIMARPTLANSLNPHPSFAQTLRPFAVSSCPKPQSHFLVFPTGNAEYPWHIAASATKRTISRHKNFI